ncbi:MAG: hypothetical protein K2H75_09410 [Muribaculaceae bacterium]|nr:hypothetical protein [Muribaculaceae bacterium]
MKRLTFHILLLLVAMGMATGCRSSETPVEPEPEDTDVMLCLSVTASNSADIYRPGTRTEEDPMRIQNPQDDNYTFEDSVTVYERINTLRVIIVRPDHTVEYNRLEKLPSSEGTYGFEELIFKVATDQGTIDKTNPDIRVEKKRIYLIANEASLLPDTLYKQLSNLKQGDQFTPQTAAAMIVSRPWIHGTGAVPLIDNSGSEKKFIPMSEFFDINVSVNLKTSSIGTPSQYESLFVTRIPVKFVFEIKAEETALFPNDSVRIKTIDFKNVTEKEYLFPQGMPEPGISLPSASYYPSKYTPLQNNDKGRIITVFGTPTEDNHNNLIRFEPPESFGFSNKENKDTNKINLRYTPQKYYCESQNYFGDIDGNTTYFVEVEAVFTSPEGGETTKTFKFEEVALPNLPALPRNTVVQINFTFQNRNLLCDVTVFPYTAVTLNPSFGFGNEN